MRALYFGTYDRNAGRNAIVIQGLRSAGVEVVECHAELWRDTGAKIAAVRGYGRGASSAVRQGLAWAALLRRYREIGRYDVMIVGATAHLDLPLARRLARRAGRPLVFDPLVSIVETVRDRALLPANSPALNVLQRFERDLFRIPDRVVVDTGAHGAAFARELGLDPGRCLVVPAGAPPVYRRLARPQPRAAGAGLGTLRVLYFGQFIPLHGLDTVLNAAARLRGRADIRFDLVGVGQTHAATRTEAQRLGLDNVRFYETWLSGERLASEHIARADVCLGVFGSQPKARRVVPFKVYTALASGRPVVTADTPAVREQLRPGEEVWTVPASNPEALADALIRFAERPDRRAALAETGQAAYDARFAGPVLGGQLRAALAALVATRSPEAGSGRAWPGATVTRGPEPSRHRMVQATGSVATASGAPAPYAGPRHRWRVRALARTLLAAAPPGFVLDAGCGWGTLSIEVAETGRNVLAFDRDLGRLRVGRALAHESGVGERLGWFCANLEAIPLGSGGMAAAAAGEVLEHIDDDGAAVGELTRVLAGGGVLALTVPAGAKRYGPADAAAGHARRYDRADLVRLLDDAGLALVILEGWGFPFGRIYDRCVQRPALAARRTRAAPGFARLGRHRLIGRLWHALFCVDGRLPGGDRGSGWLAAARKPGGGEPDSP